MQYFKNIISIDEARNNPRRILTADAVILGAGPSAARVMTLMGHQNDGLPMSGIHIADIPSMATANRHNIRQGIDPYTEDDDCVFAYAGNLYVYDVEASVNLVVMADLFERDSFINILKSIGINAETLLNELGA